MPSTARRSVLAAVGSAIIAGCSVLESSTDAATPTELTVDWTVDLGYGAATSPRVLDDRVYVSDSYKLLSVSTDAAEEPRWVFDGGVTATPAVVESDTELIVPTDRGTLSCLDPTGAVRWERSVPGDRLAAPTVADDEIVVRTETAVSLLTRDTGTIEWTVETPRFSPGNDSTWADLSPAVTDDRLYVPREDGLQCLERATGDEIWHESTRPVTATPALDDGRVYAPTRGQGLVAMDADTGTIDWQRDGVRCWTTPVVDDGIVYTPAAFDLVALEADDGEERWRNGDPGLAGRSYTDPTLLDDLLVAGGTGYPLVTVTTDGTVRAIADGPPTEFSHAIDDDTVYVATRDGISAYGLEEGRVS